MNEPHGSLNKRLELRLDEETLLELERRAKLEERTPSRVARRLIRDGLAAAQKEEAAA